MRVRLIKKLAEMIDGIDLSQQRVGEVLELGPREAGLLIAEQWAVRAEQRRSHYVGGTAQPRAVAASRPESRKMKRILVVEDHEDLRDLFQAALARAGFDVAAAGDGVQTLQHLHNDPLDLVVLDLRLPMLNGVDLHESIRSRNIPIIVVSGSPQDLGDLPVECVLTKPVMPERLVETVRRCLAMEPAAPRPPRH